MQRISPFAVVMQYGHEKTLEVNNFLAFPEQRICQQSVFIISENISSSDKKKNYHALITINHFKSLIFLLAS